MSATLPQNMEMDGRVCTQHWRSKTLAIYQNYTAPITFDPDTVCDMRLMRFDNAFHLYRVLNPDHGESLGEELGAFSDLASAIDAAAKQGQFA